MRSYDINLTGLNAPFTLEFYLNAWSMTKPIILFFGTAYDSPYLFNSSHNLLGKDVINGKETLPIGLSSGEKNHFLIRKYKSTSGKKYQGRNKQTEISGDFLIDGNPTYLMQNIVTITIHGVNYDLLPSRFTKSKRSQIK